MFLSFLPFVQIVIMKIASLYLYPIKGMKGVSVNLAHAEARGFENDRRYMLIDSKRQFISQRTHPILTQITPEVHTSTMIVSFHGQTNPLLFDLAASTDSVVTAQLFEHLVPGRLVSSIADRWFSEVLGEEVSLIQMTVDEIRSKKLVKGPEQTEVSYADGYPYLIVGTESLNQLNGKLTDPVQMDRFRPNIVVDTTHAHEEDSWSTVEIGGARFMVIKPCARCPVVTIDQSTGIRSKSVLKTLASYRKIDNKVYFGANSICLQDGIVRVGDDVVFFD